MNNYQARVVISGLNQHLRLTSLLAMRAIIPFFLYFFVSVSFGFVVRSEFTLLIVISCLARLLAPQPCVPDTLRPLVSTSALARAIVGIAYIKTQLRGCGIRYLLDDELGGDVGPVSLSR